MIRVRVFAKLREIAGTKEVNLPGDQLTLQETLERLADQLGSQAREVLFSDEKQVRPGVMLLVNSLPASKGVETAVTSQDVVTVLLPTSGG